MSGIEHKIVPTSEFENPQYLANDGQRCYHCKADLLDVMRALPAEAGTELFVGAIADDLADWRPGMKAAGERGAAFPLAEVGLTKVMIRARSQALGLATWDRPAEPCLSSRVPYGEPVTPAGVGMIEAAERHLRSLGLRTCRARHHAVGGGKTWLCRIEVPVDDLARVVEQREAVMCDLQTTRPIVALDLAGFRSGGYNDMLKAGA